MWLLQNLVRLSVRLDMVGDTVNYMPLIRRHAKAVRLIFCDVYGSDRQQDSAIIMKLCSHSSSFGVVSFDADYPVGFILLQQAADTADVIEICVRESARRQGIGRHLLEQSLHLASKHGVSRVLLEVETTNKSAYKLYKASGFNLVGKRPNYYRRRAKILDALVLERHLS